MNQRPVTLLGAAALLVGAWAIAPTGPLSADGADPPPAVTSIDLADAQGPPPPSPLSSNQRAAVAEAATKSGILRGLLQSGRVKIVESTPWVYSAAPGDPTFRLAGADLRLVASRPINFPAKRWPYIKESGRGASAKISEREVSLGAQKNIIELNVLVAIDGYPTPRVVDVRPLARP